jgi:membrane-associated PAP2 superfamily phosphatase
MDPQSPTRDLSSTRPSTAAWFSARSRLRGWRHVWLHVALVPLGIALSAWLASYTGFDRAVSDAFYDVSLARFPAHESFWLELLGHRIAKAAIWIVAIGLLGAAIGTGRTWPSAEQRQALIVAVFAMALGPAIVYLLKQTTGHHCPWDLKAYGGFADVNFQWFVAPADAGRCFPSGHASAGYSLITLAFLGHATDRPRLARGGWIAAIVVGTTYSAIRVAQGAHFMSHNLWAAAIDWWAAALVFTPVLLRRQT